MTFDNSICRKNAFLRVKDTSHPRHCESQKLGGDRSGYPGRSGVVGALSTVLRCDLTLRKEILLNRLHFREVASLGLQAGIVGHPDYPKLAVFPPTAILWNGLAIFVVAHHCGKVLLASCNENTPAK